MKWELIDTNTERAKVIGGWLVKTYENVHHITNERHQGTGWDYRVAMAFVPDPDGRWTVDLIDESKPATVEG